MSKKLTDKKRKEMLKQRWQDVKEKPAARNSTEKELMGNEQAWTEA